MLYIETSAVLRWLFGEPEGRQVVDAVNSAERVLTSTLTVLETERALIRAARTGLLTEVKAARLRKLFRDNFRGWELMEITSDIQARAAAPFPVEPVRSLDALHLATGLSFVEIYGDLQILSFDSRILDNLGPLGFQTPERPSKSPPRR
jgi:predicted nucleic acid-binding protein